jgi:hypothetical protein
MSMIRLAAAAELFLGKPVVAINTATYWHALRAGGIQDKTPNWSGNNSLEGGDVGTRSYQMGLPRFGGV